MDYAAVATSVISVLAPYVSIGAEEFARQAGRAALGKVSDLLGALRKRCTDEGKVEDTLARFEQDPQRHAADLEAVVRARLADDPAFAAEIKRHLDALRPQINVIQKIKVADHVTGARVGEVRDGEINVTQDVERAQNVTGFDGDKVG